MRWPVTRFGPDPFRADPFRFTIISLSCLLGVLGLGWWIAATAGAPFGIDLAVKTASLPSTPALSAFAQFLAEITGSSEAALVAVVLSIVLLAVPLWWRSALLLTSAVLLSAPIGNLLKEFFARARPDWHTVPVKYFSYPSGHTIGTVSLCAALILIIRRTWMWVLGIAWSVLTIWGRVYLGAHWLTDTIGGALFAVAVVTGFAAIISRSFDSFRN